MKAKNCLIFGGSGQIGRNLIRKLTKNNLKVTVVTRNIHQKSYIIKTQANAGYIDIVEANIFDEKKIRELFKKSDICINLVGILYEKKRGNTFKNIHTVFPSLLARLSKEYNLKHFIHLSALGISEAKTFYGPTGGNTPQYLLNIFAERISNGESEVVLLSGAECFSTMRKVSKNGQKTGWGEDSGGTRIDLGYEKPGGTKN